MCLYVCVCVLYTIERNMTISSFQPSILYYLNPIFQYDNAIWCLSYIHANIEFNVPARNYNIDESNIEHQQLSYTLASIKYPIQNINFFFVDC